MMTTKRHSLVFSFLLVSVFLTFLALSGHCLTSFERTTYVVRYPSLYPEGFDYWKKANAFVLGSATGAGNLVSFDLATSTTSLLVRTPNADTLGITLTSGVYVDEARQLLFACVSGPIGQPGAFSGLAGWNLTTKQNLFVSDLRPVLSAFGTSHFVNDVTQDANGNLYVTDSLMNLVLKVNSLTGEGSLFLNNANYPPNGGFGFNGIAYHRASNTLLVGNLQTGDLIRISLNDNSNGLVPLYPRRGRGTPQPGPSSTHLPASSSTVGGLSLDGPDGIIVSPNGEYVLTIGNPSGIISLVKQAPGSTNWQNARVKRTKIFPPSQITTLSTFSPSDIAVDGEGRLFALDGQINEPLSGIYNRSAFIITQIRFRQFP